MKDGYNQRIRNKMGKLDGEFDEWHYCVRQVAYDIRKDPSPAGVKKALKDFKQVMRFNNNAYYNSTRLHNVVAVAEDWNKYMDEHYLGTQYQ